MLQSLQSFHNELFRVDEKEITTVDSDAVKEDEVDVVDY